MKKRQLMICAAALASCAAVRAELPPQAVLGVYTVLGDSVQVATSTDAPADTRIERTARDSLEFKGIGFDRLALRSVSELMQKERAGTRVVMFIGPTPMTPAQQRELAEGAQRAELPAWIVQTLEPNKLTHLLLVTRHRGAVAASTGDGFSIGRGTVEGIGFYMDTLYQMRNTQTGAVSTGLLAPYLHLRLTLMDARTGDIVGTQDLREAYSYASPQTQVQADPWSFMPAEDKVRLLRKMVETAVTRGTQELLVKR